MYLNIGILEKIMNNLASMTGYSHIKGSGELGTWIWEIKTVNSRGLDVRCRLGHSLDSLEPEIRKRISDKIHRASVTVSLRFSSNPSLQKVIVNRDLVQQILDATSNLAGNIGSRPSLDAIFTVPGIVSILNVEDESKNQDLMHKDLLKSFDKALDKLRKSQLDEGNKIFSIDDNVEEQEKNLNNVLLLNPKNDEALYMLLLIKIKQSNYNKTKELLNTFDLVCKSFCSKKDEIQKKFEKLSPDKANDIN